MKKFLTVAVLLCGVMISSTASAARGVVAFYNQSSNKIVIATNMGYTCGEVMNFPMRLDRGDVVAGDLESFASHELYNLTTDTSFTMWISKYWASESQALDWLERGY
ncbi:MAG: hypothetical protein IJ685_03435 [Selenomonadaceae bacterium]|nr:hypothetical protein [Selenomonadaceae bacterium]